MAVLRHFAWDGGNINPNPANAVASPPVCVMAQHQDIYQSHFQRDSKRVAMGWRGRKMREGVKSRGGRNGGFFSLLSIAFIFFFTETVSL
jgi:hypothetical protein